MSTLNELLGLVYGLRCRTQMPQVIIIDISNNLPTFDSFIKLDVSSFYASILDSDTLDGVPLYHCMKLCGSRNEGLLHCGNDLLRLYLAL